MIWIVRKLKNWCVRHQKYKKAMKLRIIEKKLEKLFK